MSGILRQVLALLLLGAALGLGGDLVHPHGALRNLTSTLRDVELLPQVFLKTAEEVAVAVRQGEAVLLDIRPDGAYRARHVAGSVRGDPTATSLVDAATEAEFLGRDVVVVAGADQAELARQVAGNLVLLHGAGRAITVDGGFEALAGTDLPMEDGP